jgi:hypothetical protein
MPTPSPLLTPPSSTSMPSHRGATIRDQRSWPLHRWGEFEAKSVAANPNPDTSLTRPVLIRALAERDIREPRAWLDRQEAGLGDRVFEGLEETVSRIASNP